MADPLAEIFELENILEAMLRRMSIVWVESKENNHVADEADTFLDKNGTPGGRVPVRVLFPGCVNEVFAPEPKRPRRQNYFAPLKVHFCLDGEPFIEKTIHEPDAIEYTTGKCFAKTRYLGRPPKIMVLPFTPEPTFPWEKVAKGKWKGGSKSNAYVKQTTSMPPPKPITSLPTYPPGPFLIVAEGEDPSELPDYGTKPLVVSRILHSHSGLTYTK